MLTELNNNRWRLICAVPLSELILLEWLKFSSVNKALRRKTRWVRVPINLPNTNICCEVSSPCSVLLRDGSILQHGSNMPGMYMVPQFLMWHYPAPLFNLHFLLPQYKAGPSITLPTHTITNHFNSSYTPKLLFPSATASCCRNSNWFLLHYQGHKTLGLSFQVSVLCA